MSMTLDEARVWAQTGAHARRVKWARDVVRVALKSGTFVVMTSWGKDSIALSDLVLEEAPGTRLVHLRSAYELPGYDETIAYWQSRAEVLMVDDGRSVEDVIAWLREVGLPHERTTVSATRAGQRKKRDRGVAWAAANEVNSFLGMREDEGGPRAKLLRMRGPIYTSGGTRVACPLARWSALDVWAYIVARGLPYNRRVYDAETHGLTRARIRNTGWLTLADAHAGRVAWLQAHFPEQYAALERAFPQVRAIR